MVEKFNHFCQIAFGTGSREGDKKKSEITLVGVVLALFVELYKIGSLYVCIKTVNGRLTIKISLRVAIAILNAINYCVNS